MALPRHGLISALLLLLIGPVAADVDPAARAAEARKLFAQADYGGALAIWRELIAEHKKHPLVEDGDAHAGAAACLVKQGANADAAKTYESYLKSHPRGKGVFHAYTGIFDIWVEAGDEKRAQKAGKTVFKKYPDAKGTFGVLMTWIKRGWPVPKLKTSYKVLHYWAFERIDGTKWPDYRLAVLEVIARQHTREKIVKGSRILYCQAWCHMEADRPAEALELGLQYLKRQPRGDYADHARIVIAKAHLAMDPPDVAAATRLLKIVANDESSSRRQAAQDLLARAGKSRPSVQIEKGYPTAEGLGRIALLTNLSKGHAMRKALVAWTADRQPEVVTFKGEDVKSAASKLRKLGFEFVAVLVEPKNLDNNFQLSMLELCRGLDKDPMPDFHYGYLTARNADDLLQFVGRILAKEKEGGTRAREVSLPTAGQDFKGLDFLLHYGHGSARRVVKGVTARDLAKVLLSSRPVVFSGACFNGVCSSTHERFLMGNVHGKPDEVPPNEALSLAWIRAGATGVLAAMDGDRGEMAGAEWEHFKEHAPPLGAVIGHQYRLVFTSLKESFEAFPRYTPGTRKNKSFYAVMLRGQTSRILLSDPSYHPLPKPLTTASQRTTVTPHDDGTITVKVEVLAHRLGPFINTLSTTPAPPWQVRVYARVPLPEGVETTFGFPEVDSGGIDLKKVQAKHEVWGDRRYVNLQAESGNGKLASPGSVLTYTLRPVPKR